MYYRCVSGRVSNNIMLILGFHCQLLKIYNFLWFVLWIFTSVNYFYTCNFKLFFLRKDLQIMSGLRLGNLNLPVSGGQEYSLAISGQFEVISGKTDTRCPGLRAWQADSSWTNMPLKVGRQFWGALQAVHSWILLGSVYEINDSSPALCPPAKITRSKLRYSWKWNRMFFKSLKTRLKKGRGSGKKELHLWSFGNLSTCKSLTYNMCVHRACCPGWGRTWPVRVSVHSGDKGSAWNVSSQEWGQLSASELEWGLKRGSGNRKWGIAGWTLSCRLSDITAGHDCKNAFTTNAVICQGKTTKTHEHIHLAWDH